MEASPVDPNLVAVGGGDSTIRVWKTASSRPGFDVSLVWQKLSSKITAIAWHPEKEGLLAFGTDEGRIGTVDALHSRYVVRPKYFTESCSFIVTPWGTAKTVTMSEVPLYF